MNIRARLPASVPHAARGGGRVILVNRFFWPDHSATAQMLSDLAFHLAGCGWRVEVLTSRLRYDDPSVRLAPEEWVNGVQVHRLATPGFGRVHAAGRLLDYLGFHLSARRVLARRLVPGDLVIAKTDPPLLSVSLAGVVQRRGAGLVNWLQDLFPEVAAVAGVPGVAGGPLRRLRAMRDATLASAVMNVAIGERMSSWISDAGVPTARVAMIPNWADTDAIRPRPAGDSSLRRRCFPHSGVIVGYSGNLGRAHEWETLADAMRRLRQHPEIGFLFIGGGSGLSALRRQTDADGLGSARFVPYQPRERLFDSLAAPDLHLVTLRSSLEGLIVPSKLYGALAAGRPVIFVGDARGETATLLTGAGAGLAVQQGDGEGLADAIRTLAADPQRRATMGARGRQLCEERFAARGRLAQWEQTLRAVLSGDALAPTLAD
jgi:glycosyltransferase involved in cell wall biosynthesis